MTDDGGTEDWEQRVDALWARIESEQPDAFLAQVEALAAELPDGSARAAFERACAQDSTGHPDLAVPLYRQALDAGLVGLRRRRAVIQLASSLRNLGDPEQALALLDEEAQRGADELTGALAAFRALALADLGREREAVAVAVGALAAYLPRYNGSVQRYAAALRGE
ncbi:tetratricopeptide repeat protein [Motilibacter peucedani]|uniref:Tetratricopeptide repeat protein n=1 Tax=Motilibacter peucedani TaxID=598650 RepID=A0A420XUD4_9ACTN|nr:tetratricopeptide repeat protein [Motilibacter peucedani]RKS80446.1 tetratricopeptide repeat protein [Motilibacter peucedani]